MFLSCFEQPVVRIAPQRHNATTINKDTALAYNELLGEFTSFYDYGSVLYWINLEDKSLQIYNDGMYEAYKGDYGTFKGKRNSPAVIEFIANGDFDSDKVFETIELTTSDIAKINNWKADCYPFDTLEVSNEYQRLYQNQNHH
jgi:hypothetical protein